MRTKPILCAQRLRHVPRQFSWIDQRLIRDGHIRGRTTAALALYLFLCTVADARGASYYSDGRVCELLGLGCEELKAARRELVGAGLVAYSRPFYQVLSLEPHKMESAEAVGDEPGDGSGEMRSLAQLLTSMRQAR
jgi:hypothetical protein